MYIQERDDKIFVPSFESCTSSRLRSTVEKVRRPRSTLSIYIQKGWIKTVQEVFFFFLSELRDENKSGVVDGRGKKAPGIFHPFVLALVLFYPHLVMLQMPSILFIIFIYFFFIYIIHTHIEQVYTYMKCVRETFVHASNLSNTPPCSKQI